MIVVGLETSSTTAGIAVIQNHQVLADTTLEIRAVYAEQLPGLLERTMADISLKWSDVDGFAISIGPGSYTGLRVGLSLVKGLAYVTKKPVAAIPTLDSIAFQVPYCPYPVHVLVDARRGHVYEARYTMGNGLPKQITKFRVGILEDVLGNIKETVLLVGSGVDAYRPQIIETLGEQAKFVPPGIGRLMASSTAFLGMNNLLKGQHDSVNILEPLYLRKPDFAKQPPSRRERTHADKIPPSSHRRSGHTTD